jgi:hypothetical protein
MLPVEEHGGHKLASPADAVWYLDEAGNIAEDTVCTMRGQRGRAPMVIWLRNRPHCLNAGACTSTRYGGWGLRQPD